jgi:hypothetical protein
MIPSCEQSSPLLKARMAPGREPLASCLGLSKAMVPAEKRGPSWPTNPEGLGHQLTRLARELEAIGISLSRAKEGHHNRRIIRLVMASEGTIPELERGGDTVLLPSPASTKRGGVPFAVALVAICGLFLAWWSLPPSDSRGAELAVSNG